MNENASNSKFPPLIKVTKAVRKCGHVVKNLSKMKVVVGDILVVRWIWVSREILAKALFSKNSDWRNQIVLEFFLNFAVVCSSEKIPTGDVYTFGPSN